MKAIIDHIDKNTVRVQGTDIDILIKKINGFISLVEGPRRQTGIMQLTEKDAQALGEALATITK